MNIELTEPEAQTLLQLIHIAVQTRGLDAAQAGVFFQQKINAAQKPQDLSVGSIPESAMDKPA